MAASSELRPRTMDLQRALNFEEFANKETNRRPYIYDLISACVCICTRNNIKSIYST